MRPQRSRETGRASRTARARLLVKADVGWLGGYPTGERAGNGLAWIVPAAEGRPERALAVDGASLHRATRALTELELRYADVLADATEARRPRDWLASVRRAIELLKPLVHARGGNGARGATPADPTEALLSAGVHRADAVSALRAAPPAVRAVLADAAWIAVADPARLPRIVSFALAHADVAATLHAALDAREARAALLRLVLLADAEGAARLEPLARLLAARPLYEVPTAGVEYARAISQQPRGARPKKPEATLGPSLAAWTADLVGAEGRARRRALALLATLDLAPAAAAWAAWWGRVERCDALTRQEPETPEGEAAVRAKAARLVERAPRTVGGDSVRALLRSTLAWDEAAHREAARALGELPAVHGRVPLRLAFLEQWDSLFDDAAARARMPELLRPFGRYVARTRGLGPRALVPWAKLLDPSRRGWFVVPEANLVDDVPPARWPVFYEALARAVEDERDDPRAVSDALAGVVALEGDAAHALDLARELVPHHGAVRDERSRKTAYDLCGRDAASFGRALASLAKAGGAADRAYLIGAVEAVRRAGGDELARTLLVDEGPRLAACGRKLAVLDLVGGARAAAQVRLGAADAPWVAAYPLWVVPALRRLADVDVHAERSARRLLGDEVRSAAVVRKELAHLEAQADAGEVGERVRRRIANLRARLASDRTVGAALRAHLVAKVERAARRAALARFEAALDARLREKLPALLGVDAPPDWWAAERTIDRLAPIAAFSAPMRALALRVLRLRCGPPPWDLRDDPANRAFLERLGRGGVDVGPWLDGVGTQRVTAKDGKVLDLRLEDDPLEILDMGQHFATCLTPGDVNYFSTFANVADANKRVLYARGADGKVAGRCLLALTAAGGIVAFHAYAHDAKLGFEAVVGDFARDLAARMRAMVVAQGEVPRLVAPDWYDDGPVDLGGRFPFLVDDAPFRQSLAGIAPAAFAAEAARLFAPLPLGALTLPLLVALKELDARPELLAPLLPALVAAEALPLETVARAVELLARTPQAAPATRALVPRVVAGLRRASHEEDGWLVGAMKSIVAACPGDALRLLLATRARRVRTWADEHDPRRLEMAARAYEALHRPRRAATTYRLAATHAWTPAQKKDYLARAKALEAALRGEPRGE